MGLRLSACLVLRGIAKGCQSGWRHGVMEFQASPASHLPRSVEFIVACGKYLGFASGQFVVGGYIASGAVGPYGVVMPHIGFDDVFGRLQVQGCFGADALVFEASVPAFSSFTGCN